MTFVLNSEQQIALAALRDSAQQTGAYWQAYDLLYSYITDANGLPRAGVDPKAWLWLQGARLINKGEGYFSDFIREYTKQQYFYRTGETATNEQIQKASNDIAEQSSRSTDEQNEEL